MAGYAVKMLKQDIDRIKALKQPVLDEIASLQARIAALKADRDAYDAQIAENQAAIAALGG